MIDENTYIISDTHWGHKNIIRFCNRPMNHNFIMLDNWARVVQEDDTILHLGDVALGSRKEIYDWAYLIKELPGRKLLIKGNHDHSSSMKIYKGIFEVVTPFVQEIGGWNILFSHYPDERISQEWEINIHGHIHNNIMQGNFSPIVDLHKIYENVSVEVINYTPIKLSSILTKLGVPF